MPTPAIERLFKIALYPNSDNRSCVQNCTLFKIFSFAHVGLDYCRKIPTLFMESLRSLPRQPEVLSVKAFHEKAGRSQANSSFFFVDKVFLPPSGRCRHAFIRTLEERFVSLGACWAFSVQPVLLSDWRSVVLLLTSGTWARPLTQSPELGFGFCLFSSWNGFVFTRPRLRLLSLGCCCATVRTLLRSPTGWLSGLLLLGGRDLLLLPTLYAVRLDQASDRTRSAGVQIAVIGW